MVNMTLHQLAQSGDVSGLRQNLENDARDVNSLDNNGKTPLQCADFSKPEIVSLLLQYGASVDNHDVYWRSPLHLAVQSKCIESVRLILDAGVDLLLDDIRTEALYTAIDIGNGMLPIAKLLLGRGVKVTPKCGFMSLLNTAACRTNEPMVSLLLEYGADANNEGNDLPPLWYAVRTSNIAITRRLIDRGADVNKQDAISDISILQQAVQSYQPDQVKLLLESGADVNASGTNGTTALHLASAKNGEDGLRIMKHLLEGGADCDKRDGKGASPLVWALKKGDIDKARHLLKRGADLGAKDNEGWTALHYAAAIYQSAEPLEFVLDQGGFQLGERTGAGWTALHCAAHANADESCALLLRRGLDVNAKCNVGRSPLYYAAFEGKLNTADLLLRHEAEALDTLSAIVNDERDRIVKMIHRSKEVTCMLLRHLAKLECRGDATEVRRTIERNDKAREYYDKCVEELRRMGARKIFEDVTLLDILSLSESTIAGYAWNKELVRGFGVENDDTFPIFSDIVRRRFWEKVERQRMLEGAATTLDGIFGLTNDPGHIIYRKIFGYLKDREFEHLWQSSDLYLFPQ